MSIEKELIHRIKKGDVSAFETLIAGYEKKVYNTVYRFFNNTEDAKDITQEIFIKVYTSLRGFKGNSSFSTWLYRIVVNTCIDFLKKKKNNLPIDEKISVKDQKQFGSKIKSPEEFIENQELKRILANAISTLPPEQRICVMLRDVQGFSYTEISEILSCSLGTVKSRLCRARRALKDKLKDSELF